MSTLSLVNPRSLSWAIEMWGWGLFGVATWLVAPVFHENTLEEATAWTFRLNGIMSVIGVLVTAVDLAWVLTVPGIINFALWNGLMLILAMLVIQCLSRRITREGSNGGKKSGPLVPRKHSQGTSR